MMLLMMCGDSGALLNPGPESNKNTPNTNKSPDKNTNMHITHTQERGRGWKGEVRQDGELGQRTTMQKMKYVKNG